MKPRSQGPEDRKTTTRRPSRASSFTRRYWYRDPSASLLTVYVSCTKVPVRGANRCSRVSNSAPPVTSIARPHLVPVTAPSLSEPLLSNRMR